MGALSDFLTATKADFLRDLKSQDVEKWTVVMGNEAGDLDTIACSVAYSYLSSRYHKQPTIALLQTLRTDLYLRPENLYTFSLAALTPDQSELLCIDDVPVTSPLSQTISKYALVDHNRLLEPFRGKGKVAGIIDHHVDERCHLDAGLREIVNPVGSCASLVARHFQGDWDATVPPELATLLLAAIHIDTSGLRPDDKAVEIDLEAAAFLTPLSTFNNPASILPEAGSAAKPPPIALLADELSSRKKDVSNLSTRDLMRRDYKEFVFGGLRTGLSTVPCGLEASLEKDPDFWLALDHYMDERKLAVLGVLTTFKVEKKPKHRREILMLVRESQVSKEVEDRLFEGLSADLMLRLEPKPQVSVPEGRHAKVWNQKNTDASRKYTAPLVRRLIEGEQPAVSVQEGKL